MLERVALCLLLALSAIALAYSAAINLWTFSADPPAARFPGFAVLHLGVFPIVGGAAILAAYCMRKSRSEEWGESLFARIPIVLRLAILFLGLYAIGLSIEQTMIGDVGVPSIDDDGRHILHNHGRLVKVLTAEEFRTEEAGDARVASAFHMAFYVVAFAFMVACLRRPTEKKLVEKAERSSSESPSESEPPAGHAEGKRRPAWRI